MLSYELQYDHKLYESEYDNYHKCFDWNYKKIVHCFNNTMQILIQLHETQSNVLVYSLIFYNLTMFDLKKYIWK